MSKARDIASAIPAPSTVSSAELGYLDGVTSAIQTQMDAKAPSSTAVTLTGTQTLTNKTLTNPVIASVVNNTLTSTTGDMIYASAANTPARLGIGSSAQVLTVASGVPSWATPVSGSMTSIASGSLSGASVSLTSIVGTYKDLKLLLIAPTATSNFEIDLQFNTLTTSIYNYSFISTFSTSVSISTSSSRIRTVPDTLLSNGTNNFVLIDINDYASTSHFKTCNFNSGFSNNTPTKFVCTGVGSADISAAITSIQLKPSAGTFNGGTYILYGVN